MFFVIPEMPSKTFVMLYKKLPDHFKTLFTMVLMLDGNLEISCAQSYIVKSEI